MEGFDGLAARDLLTGVALAAVFEGIVYALFPGAVRRGVEMVSKTPDGALRMGGLMVAAAGVVGVWLVRT